jgi:hypothetical protein
LSVDAAHDIRKPVWVTCEIVWFVGAEGGTVSALQADVETTTLVCADRLPAASYASTATV